MKMKTTSTELQWKQAYYWITASFSEIACYWQWTLLSLKQYLLNKHWFSTKRSIKFTWNAWKQRKVQNHNENKLSYYWITASFSEIACYWQWDLLSLKQYLLNKHWFSQKGRLKSHEMLENNVKYRITMKTSYHIIGLLLVFQK